MSEKKEADMTQLTAGQQKRLEKKKEIASAKKNKIVANICWYLFIGILAVVVLGGAAYFVYRKITGVKMESNISAGLNDQGLIDNVKAADIVSLGNYKGISVPYSKIKYADKDLQAQIDSLVKGKSEASTTLERAVEDGDIVVIDYTGTMDGVAFTGGTATNQDLKLGSKSMIDGFESQIVGHKIGEEFTIDVTFPEDYGKDSTNEDMKKLAGKPAQFKIKINSVKLVKIGGELVKAEFTDAFVAEYYKDKAETAEAYKEVLRKEAERQSLETYVMDEVLKNSKATSYPKRLIKVLKSQTKYADYCAYAQYIDLYASYNMNPPFTDFNSYLKSAYNQTEAQYDVAIVETAQKQADQLLTIQAIAEKEGLSANADAYKEYLVAQGGDATTIEQNIVQYGRPYFMQQHLVTLVTKFVADAAVIDNDK